MPFCSDLQWQRNAGPAHRFARYADPDRSVSNVNGGGGSDDVDFGFFIGDVNACRTVTSRTRTRSKTDKGQTVNSSNFHDDIDLSGKLDRPD
jgi:hypothetical protein